MEDVFIEERYQKEIEIIPVETLSDVLEHTLVGKGKKSHGENEEDRRHCSPGDTETTSNPLKPNPIKPLLFSRGHNF